MQGAKIFIDSNVFLYSFDDNEKTKRDAAQVWLTRLATDGCGVTNLQVLNEVTHVSIRKALKVMTGNPFFRIDTFAEFGSYPISFATTLSARELHRSTRYAWWDCLLLASALELGCTHFLSEDMHDGQQIESLTIVDPFAHTPDQILASP